MLPRVPTIPARLPVTLPLLRRRTTPWCGFAGWRRLACELLGKLCYTLSEQSQLATPVTGNIIAEMKFLSSSQRWIFIWVLSPTRSPRSPVSWPGERYRHHATAAGLSYYRARYHDPAPQRFLLRDPIALKGWRIPTHMLRPLGKSTDRLLFPVAPGHSKPSGRAACPGGGKRHWPSGITPAMFRFSRPSPRRGIPTG
jgi:hypothetical protein